MAKAPWSIADQVIVRIDVGQVLLLAEVTRDAIERLGIDVGAPVYALVKSVSVSVVGSVEPNLNAR